MLKEFLKLVRIEHAFMLSLAVLIGYLVLGITELNTMLVLGLIVPFLVEMGAFALNDYADIEVDRVNKRLNRPLVKGTIEKNVALYSGILFLILGVLLSYFINTYAFITALFFATLSILYDFYLKDVIIVGNTFIAFSMAIPFLFAGFVAEQVTPALLLISLSAFFIGFSREIIKDCEDLKGDVSIRKSKTLPSVFGVKNALYIAFALYILFVPTSFYALIALKPDVLSFFVFMLGQLATVYGLFTAFLKNTFRFSRKVMLLGLGLGLLSYLLAAV